MVPIVHKVVLKFVTTMNGALSVMILGGVRRLLSYADNWDSLQQVQSDIADRGLHLLMISETSRCSSSESCILWAGDWNHLVGRCVVFRE